MDYFYCKKYEFLLLVLLNVLVICRCQLQHENKKFTQQVPPRIAIIGGGIGGVSTARFIEDML